LKDSEEKVCFLHFSIMLENTRQNFIQLKSGFSEMNAAQKIRSRAKCIQPVLPQNAFNMKGRKTDFFH
jgi:hypothetical protein